MTNIVIVAHRKRIASAVRLAELVQANSVLIDDGTLGAAGNHRRAWDWHTANTHSGWAVVLEDDAIPVADFRSQLDAALDCAPSGAVSLYLGRTRPPHWQGRILGATTEAEQLDVSWICGTHMLHAVGIAVRASFSPFIADWTKHLAEPIDGRAIPGMPTVAYTWPSLVDHADGPTVTDHPDGKARTTPRTAWRHGTRAEWNTHHVLMGHR